MSLRTIVQRGRRGLRLLEAGYGVTWSYAAAAVECGLVDVDDLRGCGHRGRRRWYLV